MMHMRANASHHKLARPGHGLRTKRRQVGEEAILVHLIRPLPTGNRAVTASNIRIHRSANWAIDCLARAAQRLPPPHKVRPIVHAGKGFARHRTFLRGDLSCGDRPPRTGSPRNLPVSIPLASGTLARMPTFRSFASGKKRRPDTAGTIQDDLHASARPDHDRLIASSTR